jgi:hypothetical protein
MTANPPGKHQTQRQNWPQLQNAAQPLPYLLHQRSWNPLGLLGYHSIGSGVQKSNPTRFRRDDVLLRQRHILQKQTHFPTRRPQGHGDDLRTSYPTELEGFRQIGSFIVVCEQLIVCVQ